MPKRIYPSESSSPLELLKVSHYYQIAGTQPIPHRIPSGMLLIELVTGGCGWVRTHSDWKKVGVGDLIWQDRGEETIGRSDPDDPYRCLAVGFAVSRSFRRPVPRFCFWNDPTAVELLARKAPSLFVDERFDRVALMHYLFGVLIFHSVAGSGKFSAPAPPAVQAAMDWIEDRYHETMNTTELCQIAGCSPQHLRLLFQRHCGVSPHRMLIQRRLRAAKERLVSSRDSIKEIAFTCGFPDPAAFSHAFKSHTGRSPAEFRRGALALIDL